MKKAIIISIISLIFFGCNIQNHQQTTNMKMLSIDFNDPTIFSDEPALTKVRYLKLETSDECLIEGIYKVLVHDSLMYILTTPGKGNLFIFNNQGRFISKFSKGEGPEEIIYPTDIAINDKNQSLMVLDTYRTIKEFSLNGKFLRKTIFEKPYFSLESVGDEILLFDPNSQAKSEYYLHTLSADKDFLKKPFKGTFFALPNFFTKISPEKVLVSHMFSDTIYTFEKSNQLRPYLYLDFHGKNANTSSVFNEVHSLGEYSKMANERDLISGPSNFSVLGDDKFFFTLKGKKNLFATSTGDKVTLHKQLFQDLPNIYGSSGRTDKEVIFVTDMPWLMEYFQENNPQSVNIKQLKQLCTNEDDNPVLFFGSF